jgi:cellulose synthase (UDP-forming)
MKTENMIGDSNKAVIAEKVFTKWDYVIFGLLTLINFSVILYFIRYWTSLDDWHQHPISLSTLTIILLVIVVNYLGRWFLLLCMKRPQPILPKAGLKVAVVTTFVPGAEGIEMLRRTLRALVALDYPHDTWVLDEGESEQAQTLCRQLGAKYFSRKNLPQYQTEFGIFQARSKHGNYNAWLYEIGFSQYDILTAFDPDHVPYTNFLTEVLGFFEDAKVGYVQAAQAYYNQNASLIARGGAEETYAYYSSIQMASYGLGYPIVTGSHNTHRMRALKEVGGFAPHDADDLLITILYQQHGWQGVYVPKILARGLTPVNWAGYLRQQRRWARSVLDIKLRIYPGLAHNLARIRQAMGYLHGLNYLYKSFAFFIGMLILLYLLVSGDNQTVLRHLFGLEFFLLFGTLFFCDFFRKRFYLDVPNELNLHWRTMFLQYAKWPYILLALTDVILKRQISYEVTLKVSAKSRILRFFLPHLLVVTLVSVAWVIGVVIVGQVDKLLHIIVMAILVTTVGIILSEYIGFPAPYDDALIEQNANKFGYHPEQAD